MGCYVVSGKGGNSELNKGRSKRGRSRGGSYLCSKKYETVGGYFTKKTKLIKDPGKILEIKQFDRQKFFLMFVRMRK